MSVKKNKDLAIFFSFICNGLSIISVILIISFINDYFR
jgi:hypothetical protein